MAKNRSPPWSSSPSAVFEMYLLFLEMIPLCPEVGLSPPGFPSCGGPVHPLIFTKSALRERKNILSSRDTLAQKINIYIYVNKNARRRALTAVCGVSPWEHHQAMSSLVLMHRGWRRKGSEPLLGVTWMDPPPKVEEINVALVLMSAAANNLPHDSSFATS